jgi:hypothetical protein
MNYWDNHMQTSERIRRDYIDNAMIRSQRILNDLEHHAIDEFRRIDTQYAYFRRLESPSYLPFRNELERIRHFYKLYVESIDTVSIEKYAVSAVTKLLSRLTRLFSSVYYLNLILREQKRLQQKIKSLNLPIKIIPDSLRPIEFTA